MNQGELLAIGGAYVDINAPDFPLSVDGLHLETEVVGRGYQLELGGSAVNFARVCSALEVPAAFIGKVGKDEMGRILADLLVKAQVEPSLVVSEDVSTNLSFNMVNKAGESIMAVVGTANQALTADEVYARASELLAATSYLFLGGCFKLKKLMPAFVKLASDAKTAGVKVALDHGRVNKDATEDEKRVVRELVLATDIYLPSADEFMQLWNVHSIEDGLKLMSEKGVGVTVVKNSDKGAVTVVDGELITIPAFAVNPLHTIGAGDSFNAGFIAAQHKGKNLTDSVQFGCATAALKISRQSLPTYGEVVSFMAQQASVSP